MNIRQRVLLTEQSSQILFLFFETHCIYLTHIMLAIFQHYTPPKFYSVDSQHVITSIMDLDQLAFQKPADLDL